MKAYKYLLPKALFLIALSSLFVLLSCEKESNSNLNQGQATLSVVLAGIETNSEDLALEKSSNTKTTASAPEVLEIPINKNLSAYVTLEEEKHNTNQKKLNSLNKIGASELSAITAGVQYGILVYDGDNLVPNGQRIFTAGQEASAQPFALDGGKTYTFIGYSRNSTTSIPTVSNSSKLSTAQIKDETGDLLFIKKQQTVNAGSNNLSISLKHQFTLVTTQLKVGTTFEGVIQQVQSGSFAKSRDKASLKLADGIITYSATEQTSAISFPTIAAPGVTTIQSNPNLLIAGNSNNIVTYTFPSIKVNNIIGTIPATTFNMQAGKKYNLIITLDVPCKTNSFTLTNRINGGGSVTSVDSLSKTFYSLSTKQNLVFNFTLIDNNFNIFINNKPLFEARYLITTRTRTTTRSRANTSQNWPNWTNTGNFTESSSSYTSWQAHDADFQASSNVNIRTMVFSDANYWGEGTVSAIYNIAGTETNPTVRITIQSNGSSTITGKRTTTSTTQRTINTISAPSYPNNPSNDDYLNNPIHNASPITEVITTSANQIQQTRVETYTAIRSMEFRKNSVPFLSNGTRDVIRIKQSTKHSFPKSGTSITDLSAILSPMLNVNCTTNQ